MTALDLGLIDSLGTMHQVLVQKFGEDYRLVTIQAKSGLSLMSAFSSSRKTIISDTATQIIETVDEKAWWSRLGL